MSTATVQLVAVDVDGTLLERDASFPDDRAAAFAALVDAVPTMLATGKTAPSITALVERFRPRGPHAICNGAALVGDDGAIEVLAALDDDVAGEVLDALEAHDVAAAAYLADGGVVARRADARLSAITDLGEPEPRVGGTDGVPVLKVLAVLAAGEEGPFTDLASDRARLQRTGPSFFEWNAPAASKGAAVNEVAERLGVAMRDVVAIGDSENDVSMLAAAGWGVAVLHSSDAAVSASDEHLDADVTGLLRRLAGSETSTP